jgi:hypothetical protein
MWSRCRGCYSKPPGSPGHPRSHDSCVDPRSGGRAKAGLQLLRRDRNEEHRHATVLHVSAGLRDRGLFHPSLVQQRMQVGLVGTHPRVVIPVVRIVRGVAHLIARPTPHDTQRAVLCHTRPPFSSVRRLAMRSPLTVQGHQTPTTCQLLRLPGPPCLACRENDGNAYRECSTDEESNKALRGR